MTTNILGKMATVATTAFSLGFAGLAFSSNSTVNRHKATIEQLDAIAAPLQKNVPEFKNLNEKFGKDRTSLENAVASQELSTRALGGTAVVLALASFGLGLNSRNVRK